MNYGIGIRKKSLPLASANGIIAANNGGFSQKERFSLAKANTTCYRVPSAEADGNAKMLVVFKQIC